MVTVLCVIRNGFPMVRTGALVAVSGASIRKMQKEHKDMWRGKKRIKHRLSRAAHFFLLACTVSLAACGGGGASGTPGAAASTTNVPTPSPAPAPAPVTDVTSPSIPAGLSAKATSPAQVSLSWQSSSDNIGVAGYQVFRGGTKIAETTTTNYTDTGLSSGKSYLYTVAAYDQAGNHSAQSNAVSVTTPIASTGIYYGNPSNYLSLLRALKAGETLVLEAGNYDNTNDVAGFPIFSMNGTANAPITITGPETGPRAVLLGRADYNTIRFSDASYIVVRNLEIDGRNLGGDGVNAQGTAHHIMLENLLIHGVGDNQQVVGISTNGGSTWNWTIRNCTILSAGTGMYLGNPNGINPFVAGLIEHNLIRDTIGYNIEIKHQGSRPSIAGMPTDKSSTVIRHNVFSKSSNSSTGGDARPNLLVGYFPPSGSGADDFYEIYGNFFYQNPTEALFQGEGNIAFHHNLLLNDSGSAIHIQPHNDVPKSIRIFNNTVVASDTGISVSGGSTAYQQKVIGNAVFAGSPISASDKAANITDSYTNAVLYLANPNAALGSLSFYPIIGQVKGSAIDPSSFNSFVAWDLDFNGVSRDPMLRGAYAGEGTNPGWIPKLEIMPAFPGGL
jgi:hypothetical protein